MSYLSIEGGAPLHGELTIQGSKNSVLPVLAATILARDVCRIENCPRLRDVDASVAILRHLGCRVRRDGTALEVDTAPMARCDIPDELMREMRSSIIFLGAILARQGEAVCGPLTCIWPPCASWARRLPSATASCAARRNAFAARTSPSPFRASARRRTPFSPPAARRAQASSTMRPASRRSSIFRRCCGAWAHG